MTLTSSPKYYKTNMFQPSRCVNRSKYVPIMIDFSISVSRRSHYKISIFDPENSQVHTKPNPVVCTFRLHHEKIEAPAPSSAGETR